MKGKYRAEAQHRSATFFLNSLLREWKEHEFSRTEAGEEIVLPLGPEARLRLPLARRSTVGRHAYTGKFFFELRGDVAEIGFESLVERVIQSLAARFKCEDGQTRKFRDRILASSSIIRSILETRAESFDQDLGLPPDFLGAEQGLLFGHSFHPTPKSRDEFSDQDLRAYSPEFKAKFGLEWLLADPSIVHQVRAESFGDRAWTEELLRQEIKVDASLQARLKTGRIPILMHPWQLEKLLAHPVVSQYVADGRLERVGASSKLWSPTSSLRSLYREDAPYMVKFSMSLKLTNSVRHLFTHEVDRGLQLRDVLATPRGQEFLASRPAFRVVTEPAYLALKDAQGQSLPETIVVCRENPFRGKESQSKAVLATLTQDPVSGGENLIQRLVHSMDSSESLASRARRWFRAYLRTAVEPLFEAQSNYGIILGGHQQNLILGFENGLPVTAWFRDCQGTGYSELGFSEFAARVPTITRTNGNVVTERMGNALFTYYVMLNSTFNVVAALAGLGEVTEEMFLTELRGFLKELRARGPRDPSCLDALLSGKPILHKGNFFCSFTSLNENTTTDPLAIYVPVENPLGERHAFV